MKTVTKVFVGAVTMFANGTLLNMAGTAIVTFFIKSKVNLLLDIFYGEKF